VKYVGPVLLDRGACPYLPDREWRSMSLEGHAISAAEMEKLLEMGFRRSGTEFYIPRCQSCQACIPLRLPVQGHRLDKAQRRTWRANADLTVEVGEPGYTEEKLDLYRRYLEGKFSRVDLPGRDEYDYFLGFSFGWTREFQYRLEGRLIGLGIVDATPSAASSVYFCYDLAWPRRRLGVYSLLYELEWCRRTGRSHLYLGLWIEECPSMAYKAGYRPHEILLPHRGWHEPAP
jgi:arginine-tRNA-protein transferase